MSTEKTLTKQLGGNSVQGHSQDSAIVEQSHSLESLIGEKHHGRVTDYGVEVSDIDGEIPVKMDEDGNPVVPEETRLSSDRLFESDGDTTDLALFNRLSADVITDGVQIDVPIEGTDDTYVTITAEITVHLQLDCEELVKPLYYTVDLADRTLGNVFTHSYLESDISVLGEVSPSAKSFQERNVLIRFCEMDTVRLEKRSDSVLSKVHTTLSKLFVSAESEVEVPDGQVHPRIGLLLFFAIFGLFGSIVVILGSVSIGMSGPLVPLLVLTGIISGIGWFILTGVLRSYIHQFTTNAESAEIVSTYASSDSRRDTFSEMTVDIEKYDDSIYFTDQETGARWKLPEQNGVLTESATQFIRSVGVEEVGSSVIIETSKNQIEASEKTSVQVDDSRYFYV
jgi:hypothetical protein